MDAKLLEVLKRIETHLGTVERDVNWIRRHLAEQNQIDLPPLMPVHPGRFSPATKLKVCLLIEEGHSGSYAGATVGVTSSTANTWYRQWKGRYRDGRPLPSNRIPAWVAEARRIHEAGEL